MKTIILFFHSILLFTQFIYSQWDLVYPDIPTDHINDLIFLDQYKGYCVNKAGDILETSNGGLDWEIIKYYPEHSIVELKFLDELNGFSFVNKLIFQQGDVPFIYTTDGGDNWEEAQITMNDARSFLPISLSQMIKSVNDGIKKLDNFFND